MRVACHGNQLCQAYVKLRIRQRTDVSLKVVYGLLKLRSRESRKEIWIKARQLGGDEAQILGPACYRGRLCVQKERCKTQNMRLLCISSIVLRSCRDFDVCPASAWPTWLKTVRPDRVERQERASVHATGFTNPCWFVTDLSKCLRQRRSGWMAPKLSPCLRLLRLRLINEVQSTRNSHEAGVRAIDEIRTPQAGAQQFP